MQAFKAAIQKRVRQVRRVILPAIYLFVGTLILAFDTQVQLGDVAQEDIFAPVSIVYESEVETELARERARAEVSPIYNRIENAGSQQITLLNNILAYITLVRNDPPQYALQEQKIKDLQAIEALKAVEVNVWLNVLNANNQAWDRIAADITDVLNRTMRQPIPPQDLAITREQLYTRVDSTFSDSQQEIVVVIVGELLIPNRVLNVEATEAERNLRASQVEPQLKRFESGEIIVSKGEPLEVDDLEALEQLDLIGQGHNNWRGYTSACLLLVLVTVILLYYAKRFYPDLVESEPMVILSGILILIFLGMAKLFSEAFPEAQSLYPGAALALLMTTLFGSHMGAAMIVSLAVLIATLVDNSLEFAAYITFGGLAGVLTLKHTERLNAYFIAGFNIGAANALVLNAFLLTSAETQGLVGAILTNLLFGILGGLFAAVVAMGMLLIVGNTMNLTTSYKLLELMQPNQPLLKQLLRDTPGTYQHSLQVANLAEQASERIGANSTLIRVGAMYHDIGKMLNPQFFVENQASGINPHELLADPWQSAKIIIDHVVEGDRMARRHRLPERIRDFIREHHGTTMPLYFYNQALAQVDNDASKLDLKEFIYPGPKPQSKETALLMLADGIESAARARKPQSAQEIVEVVHMIMDTQIQKGQLDESHLTLNDLKAIREVFIEGLQGIYHTRIAYPEPLKEMKLLQTEFETHLTESEPASATLSEAKSPSDSATPESKQDEITSSKLETPIIDKQETETKSESIITLGPVETDEKPMQVKSKPIPVKPRASTNGGVNGSNGESAHSQKESLRQDTKPSSTAVNEPH